MVFGESVTEAAKEPQLCSCTNSCRIQPGQTQYMSSSRSLFGLSPMFRLVDLQEVCFLRGNKFKCNLYLSLPEAIEKRTWFKSQDHEFYYKKQTTQQQQNAIIPCLVGAKKGFSYLLY